jgi:hypothetical protein
MAAIANAAGTIGESEGRLNQIAMDLRASLPGLFQASEEVAEVAALLPLVDQAAERRGSLESLDREIQKTLIAIHQPLAGVAGEAGTLKEKVTAYSVAEASFREAVNALCGEISGKLKVLRADAEEAETVNQFVKTQLEAKNLVESRLKEYGSVAFIQKHSEEIELHLQNLNADKLAGIDRQIDEGRRVLDDLKRQQEEVLRETRPTSRFGALGKSLRGAASVVISAVSGDSSERAATEVGSTGPTVYVAREDFSAEIAECKRAYQDLINQKDMLLQEMSAEKARQLKEWKENELEPLKQSLVEQMAALKAGIEAKRAALETSPGYKRLQRVCPEPTERSATISALATEIEGLNSYSKGGDVYASPYAFVLERFALLTEKHFLELDNPLVIAVTKAQAAVISIFATQAELCSRVKHLDALEENLAEQRAQYEAHQRGLAGIQKRISAVVGSGVEIEDVPLRLGFRKQEFSKLYAAFLRRLSEFRGELSQEYPESAFDVVEGLGTPRLQGDQETALLCRLAQNLFEKIMEQYNAAKESARLRAVEAAEVARTLEAARAQQAAAQQAVQEVIPPAESARRMSDGSSRRSSSGERPLQWGSSSRQVSGVIEIPVSHAQPKALTCWQKLVSFLAWVFCCCLKRQSASVAVAQDEKNDVRRSSVSSSPVATVMQGAAGRSDSRQSDTSVVEAASGGV